jgi:deoxyguanosine kinase
VNTQAQFSMPVERTRARPAPRFVVVEGPIGVGKTTLARRLAEHYEYPVLLEPSTENPFLDRFYREGRRHALPTQLYFLLHRARQMADLPRNDLVGSSLVCDFLMDKDDLFARLTLDQNEYALYRQIYDSLDIEVPTPDLVIYLQAPGSRAAEPHPATRHRYERDIDATTWKP